jgi:hypothetical protein
MALPRDKRQTKEQAEAFATKAVEAHNIRQRGDDPRRRVMTWLAPRTGKA